MINAADIQAILLSTKVATAATLISLPFGFLCAYVLCFHKFPGKIVLEGLINLPLTLPPVVIGYLLLILFGANGPLAPLLNSLGVRLIFTWKAAVIASAVVGFPLLVRSTRIGMESIDLRLIHASRTLGAAWHDTLISVIAPLSLRGLIAGSSLMFARSLGEFGATIIVAGNIPGITQTIPLAIYDYAASPQGDQAALLLCGISVALSLAILIFHDAIAGRLTRKD